MNERMVSTLAVGYMWEYMSETDEMRKVMRAEFERIATCAIATVDREACRQALRLIGGVS